MRDSANSRVRTMPMLPRAPELSDILDENDALISQDDMPVALYQTWSPAYPLRMSVHCVVYFFHVCHVHWLHAAYRAYYCNPRQTRSTTTLMMCKNTQHNVVPTARALHQALHCIQQRPCLSIAAELQCDSLSTCNVSTEVDACVYSPHTVLLL